MPGQVRMPPRATGPRRATLVGGGSQQGQFTGSPYGNPQMGQYGGTQQPQQPQQSKPMPQPQPQQPNQPQPYQGSPGGQVGPGYQQYQGPTFAGMSNPGDYVQGPEGGNIYHRGWYDYLRRLQGGQQQPPQGGGGKQPQLLENLIGAGQGGGKPQAKPMPGPQQSPQDWSAWNLPGMSWVGGGGWGG